MSFREPTQSSSTRPYLAIWISPATLHIKPHTEATQLSERRIVLQDSSFQSQNREAKNSVMGNFIQ